MRGIIDPEFLRTICLTMAYLCSSVRLSGGTTFQEPSRVAMHMPYAGRFAVPLSVHEQAAIARILDTLDTAIRRRLVMRPSERRTFSQHVISAQAPRSEGLYGVRQRQDCRWIRFPSHEQRLVTCQLCVGRPSNTRLADKYRSGPNSMCRADMHHSTVTAESTRLAEAPLPSRVQYVSQPATSSTWAMMSTNWKRRITSFSPRSLARRRLARCRKGHGQIAWHDRPLRSSYRGSSRHDLYRTI